MAGMNLNQICTLAFATDTAAPPILAAIAALQAQQENSPIPQGATPIGIYDAVWDINVAMRDMAGFFSGIVAPPTSRPAPAGYASVFKIQGNFMVGSALYFIEQTLADFAARQSVSAPELGDKNRVICGIGAAAFPVTVGGCPVYLQISQPGTGPALAQPAWGPPSAS